MKAGLNKTPSLYNVDAWEDSDLLLTTYAAQPSLLKIPAVIETTLKMDENFAIATQKRVSSISLSAEERYVKLVKTYPEFCSVFLSTLSPLISVLLKKHLAAFAVTQ